MCGGSKSEPGASGLAQLPPVWASAGRSGNLAGAESGQSRCGGLGARRAATGFAAPAGLPAAVISVAAPPAGSRASSQPPARRCRPARAGTGPSQFRRIIRIRPVDGSVTTVIDQLVPGVHRHLPFGLNRLTCRAVSSLMLPVHSKTDEAGFSASSTGTTVSSSGGSSISTARPARCRSGGRPRAAVRGPGGGNPVQVVLVATVSSGLPFGHEEGLQGVLARLPGVGAGSGSRSHSRRARDGGGLLGRAGRGRSVPVDAGDGAGRNPLSP